MKQEIMRIDLGGVNAYLGRQGDSFILFDTGGNLMRDKQFDNRRAALLSQLESNGCNAENLKLIVLTHGDSDHATNAAFLAKRFGVQIAMHPMDIELVDHPTLEKAMETFRYRSVIFKVVFLFIRSKLERITRKVLEHFESFKPDILLNEGDSLEPYGFNAKVLHLPGHTRGSIGILTEQNDLISGDIFANVEKVTTAPNAHDFKKLDESIKRIKAMDIQSIYLGHGEPFVMKAINT